MVQGITGREATMMVADMQAHGSSIVAGVTPGKGGLRVHGVPVYDTVDQAVQRAGVKAGNRGWDAALNAVEMASLMAALG